MFLFHSQLVVIRYTLYAESEKQIRRACAESHYSMQHNEQQDFVTEDMPNITAVTHGADAHSAPLYSTLTPEVDIASISDCLYGRKGIRELQNCS